MAKIKNEYGQLVEHWFEVRVPTGQYAGNRGAEMNKIKEIRKAKKMRLRELSAATGIVIQTISRYELGQQKLTLDAAMKIAAALGVKVEELI